MPNRALNCASDSNNNNNNNNNNNKIIEVLRVSSSDCTLLSKSCVQHVRICRSNTVIS